MLSVAASSRGAYRRRGFRRVLIGPADRRVTGHAGVAVVAEVDRVLGISSALDGAVGSIKSRRRGVSAGGLLLSMASAHMTGADFLDGIGVVNTRVLALVSPRRRAQLLAAATIDGDTTDVEVYGRDKQDAVYNYQGQRAYRPHIAFWAEGGVTLAADLMKADEDPRPVAAQLLDRAIAQLPPG